MKCLFLHYIQLLMIGCAIQMIKVVQNAKKKKKKNGKNLCGKIDLTKTLTPPRNEKVGNLAKKFYGRFGMTKI